MSEIMKVIDERATKKKKKKKDRKEQGKSEAIVKG